MPCGKVQKQAKVFIIARIVTGMIVMNTGPFGFLPRANIVLLRLRKMVLNFYVAFVKIIIKVLSVFFI
jgi:hypothetical protein